MDFKVGDKAYIKNVGYGLVSYEQFTVEQVRDGCVKLQHLDTWYDAETGRGAPPDPVLELECLLCVTAADIRWAEEYVSEEGDGCLR